MKLNLLKGFAAVAILCMVGAVFATPVAIGDCGAYLANNADSEWAKALGYAAQGVGTTALRAAGTTAMASWELYLVCPEAAAGVAAVGLSGLALSA